MKTITLSLLLFASATSVSAQVVSHTNPAAFADAFQGSLVTENFDGAPDQPSICGPVVSSSANDCFSAGELIEGFEISSTNDGVIVLLPAGFLPSDNSSPRIGANSGAETTVITFTGTDAVYAAGHALHVDNNGSFNYKVFNEADEVIFEEEMTHSAFFGVTSSEPIGKIEVRSVANSGELIGDLRLGRQSTMGVVHGNAAGVALYPNPTTGIINLKGNDNISTVAVYNMLGQQVYNNAVNSDVAIIDITDLSAGNYILIANYEGGAVANMKIIKN